MKLLCAVDFSDASHTAARAAGRLARALGAELHVVHGAHLPGVSRGTSATPTRLAQDELERRKTMLSEFCASLPSPAHPILREGLPDEAILAVADELEPDLLVIGATGDRRSSDWGLGSVAMRVIKSSNVPVLVVREDASFERWLAGRGALRVLVGVEPRKPSHPTLDWLVPWKRAGAIEVNAAHVYMPGVERRLAAVEAHERELATEIASLWSAQTAFGTPHVRVLGGFGRTAEHLMDLAASDNADLVVVGTHRRRGWNRWLHGSVSLDIVGSARRNCLSVPLVSPPAEPVAPGAIERVLVPVDFSALSSRGVAWAIELLPRGGTLQLVHIVTPFVPAATEFGTYIPLPTPNAAERERERAELERKLRDAVPAKAEERGLQVAVEVLEGFDPATQIVSAAARMRSQVICICTHGRSGWSRALLGSVAQGVLRHAGLPVFVIPPTDSRRSP